MGDPYAYRKEGDRFVVEGSGYFARVDTEGEAANRVSILNAAFVAGRESAEIEPDGVTTIDSSEGSEEYEAAIGVVPRRFKAGDKVARRSKENPVEVVEKVEWIREVWHSIEPYWKVLTDTSSGGQAGYVMIEPGPSQEEAAQETRPTGAASKTEEKG